ncbi:VanW family protein [Paenibacillus xylaniclasticus]|uniref:VanW family protein n=1 Tax=Paenibacillus xylaniclasticus TaxID=588083 RepID=UPI000FD83A31|nr:MULTISPECIES: VanW family protein [Paenibacillus]GFN32634.1 vancomycin resistance protein [Paenibacillus curdlanolyticus]
MKRVHITFIVVISVLLLGSVSWGAIWIYANDSTVPQGTTAGGIPIGGLDIDNAASLLSQYAVNWEQQQAAITANDAGAKGDTRSWTLKELGYTVDISEAKAAVEQLRAGGIIDRARYRYSFDKTLDIRYSSDSSLVDREIRKQWGWIDTSAAVDAKRIITENDRIVYTPHQVAYRIDVDTLRKKLDESVRSLQTNPPTTAEQLRKVLQRRITAALPIKVVEPAVTLEKLKAEGIDRMIMSFTTDFTTSAEGRAFNVTATAKSLNDTKLAPGEVFDYSKIVKATERSFGYREAPVIQNGKLVPGIGGGICQVSSTLYNAVLRVGIDIVERRNHSIPVSYLPLGQDATFSEGGINFRFRNTTGKHLIIRTVVENKKLTVKLFGTMPENVRYDIESKTVSTIKPTIKETVNDRLPKGSRIIVQQGKPGYVVETYRTMYKDGVEISRKRISRDTYKAEPTLVSVGKGEESDSKKGPGTPAEPKEEIIEDGITAP